MPRSLVLLLAFAAACPAAAEPATPANTLTARESRAGWLLLFDGESTLGWKVNGEARVEKGGLVLGGTKETRAEATVHLRHHAVRLEAAWTGDAPPSLDLARPTGPALDRGGRGTFRPLTGQTDLSEAAVRSPVVLRVPAGSTLTLRNVKVRPLGAESLFDGKSLDGWVAFKGKGKTSRYSVTPEGWLNVRDGPGDLQTKRSLGDFVLQLECISNGKHLNSGVFFRCLPNQYQQGYEAQIRNEFTDRPTQRYTVEEYDPQTHRLVGRKVVASTAVDFGTGAIYRRVPARKAVARDGEWFTLTVAACGRHFATWVNGVPVVDWTDNRPAHDNPRQGYRAAAGPISIQGHDPTTDLSFRNIRVAPLDPK